MHVLRVSSRDDVRVRPARPADALRLAEIHVASWHNAYRKIMSRRLLDRTTVPRSHARFADHFTNPSSDTGYYLLEHTATGRVWGYVGVGPQRSDRHPYFGEVYELYVTPTHQGEGVGHLLLTAGIWSLVDRGLNPAMVWVLHDNALARRFYESCGGRMIAAGDAWLGRTVLPTVAYGWPDTLPYPID